MTSPVFHRAELLLGPQNMQKLAETRVILFGVGGVGSWCAEALVRSGIGHLTIVDNDVVCITNVNRQLQATTQNVGKVKVDELKTRLCSINPEAEIVAEQKLYNEHTRDEFPISTYNYVIDAIDSLSYKVDLIEYALRSNVKLFSSMGSACKLDITRIQVSSIWKSDMCPLARQVRKRLRRHQIEGDFLCVWSDELLPNQKVESVCGSGKCFCPKKKIDQEPEPGEDTWCSRKAQINGSLVHITGTFGFILAGLVIQDVYSKIKAAL